ncbi:hypothetical protein AALO_G00089630%2C partial [Xyrichtys novacula]|uniref:Transposable element P transposase-like RNase H domain-containing protein n=1 Tax=Xyrichtys novacula TaxID=13765 RepID=A0AAV1FAB8_XYRNO|nr:hypothetical protein AALO_G00089630%2C partial [Xyrichtys novacula]
MVRSSKLQGPVKKPLRQGQGTSNDRATVNDLREQLRIETLRRKRVKRALKQQKKINFGLRKKNNLIQKKFRSIFNTDQIQSLGREKKRWIRWSNQTLKKAIQIRFTAGTTGYKTLQKMKIPRPDIRTTQQRMQHVKMEPGVLMEVIKMLKLKAEGINKMERECVLTLEEMAISPGMELHMGARRLFGNATLPSHTGQAMHACVFKQIVAYHYSGNSTDGSVYQLIIIATVEAAASVSSAMHIFNMAMSAALRYLVEEEQRSQSYLVTSWFLEKVDHWFDLMSSRNVATALSLFKMEEYEKAIHFLQDSIHLFRGLKIGHLGSWKPVQTGLVMATRVILEVQQDLLSKGHKFVLTSRFTQDCLENTFSCIPQRNPVPTPAEFHYALRAVTVGQFLTTVPTGNYLDDGSDHLADFLDSKRSSCSPPPVVCLEQLDDPASLPDFTKKEFCVLYHLAGYIVKRVIGCSLCEECQSSLIENENASERDVLLRLKEFKREASDEVFTLIQSVEQLIPVTSVDSLMESTNAVAMLEQAAMKLDSNLP